MNANTEFLSALDRQAAMLVKGPYNQMAASYMSANQTSFTVTMTKVANFAILEELAQLPEGICLGFQKIYNIDVLVKGTLTGEVIKVIADHCQNKILKADGKYSRLQFDTEIGRK